MTEFLGYDTPTNFVTLYKDGRAEKTGLPLPRLRTRQMSASVNVWDGQTLVLGGMIAEDVERVKTKGPVLGSVPLVGRAFRSESSKTVKKNLMVFVTPTLLDPAGNRLHTEEDVAFTQNSLPPQPADVPAAPRPQKWLYRRTL